MFFPTTSCDGTMQIETSRSFPSEARAHGPLLRTVLAAQGQDERASSYPWLRELADALVNHSRGLDHPLLWPIGDAAERLTGAAVLLGEGDVRARGWTDVLSGEAVLLIGSTFVTPMPIREAAERAQTLGAGEVHACVVEAVDWSLAALRGCVATCVELGGCARPSLAAA